MKKSRTQQVKMFIFSEGCKNNNPSRVNQYWKTTDSININHYDRFASVTDMIKDLGWATLEMRRRQSRLMLM